MADLPEIKITWSGASTEVCAKCARRWGLAAMPVPSAYTVASIEADDVPVPVCDYCIDEHYAAETFAELLAKRQRFHAE